MGSAAPLTLPELTAALDRIGGFERRAVVAVAVSGGPDSMALAFLADCWARERGGAVRAVTIDHGLRPESADEARRVAAWLGARGIAHDTLVWAGDKPKGGIQEAARAARYRLLAGWCAGRGILHLMTAHHREDQAETYLIRHRAGSGADGLAGMAAARELPGCRLVRPLLAVPRARLAALLAAEGQPFLVDPSNRSPVFDRGRLRAAAALDEAGVEEAIAETRRRAAARIGREAVLDELLARCVALHPAGIAAIDAAGLRAAPVDLAEALLARVAMCIGGLGYPPRRERVARLRAALADQTARARTLGGCRFVFWRGRILVFREIAAAEPPVRLAPGDERRWDRRFHVRLPGAAFAPVTFGYPAGFVTPAKAGVAGGRRSSRPLDSRGRGHADEGSPNGLPPLLRSALPAVEDGAVAAVDLALVFRPANPLTHAGFAVV